MKKLIILAAVMMLAVPAFAAVQNVKVSGDIETFAVSQNEFDLLDTVGNDTVLDDLGFIATITRLRIDADLTDNVAATIRLANEREWDVACSATTNAEIDLAYLTMKEMFYSPLTLTIGRQELAYGSKLVVGDPTTNAVKSADSGLTHAPFLSKMKAFDAIRGVLDYDPWTIDLLYAKVDEVFEATDSEDEDILGLNLAYDFVDYDGELEAYVFCVDGDVNSTGATDIDAAIFGLRGSLVPADGLVLGAEVAFQSGDYTTSSGSTAARNIDAMAATVEGSYAWDNEYEPAIKLCYDYRSGQKSDKSTGDYEAWLPLYEDQSKGLIADYLFAGVNGGVNSNAHIINLGASLKPMEDLTIGLDWFKYILDEEITTSATGATISSVYSSNSYTMKKDDDLGDEIDVTLLYDYSEDVQFGLKAGYFMPGDAFAYSTAADTTNDEAIEVIGSVVVSF
ncbi:MAG: alginate export family protein [Candidatus Saelkia tenebricola]|nr:alginate export family protein [Candidatus Saelkia tenebricola]